MTHQLYCSDCMDPCEQVEETFDYAGTHCTHGRAGTKHTGHFVSKCCGAELVDDINELMPEGWHCWLDVKPIPDRDHDWNFSNDNYDGADGGNGLAGTGASIRDCLEHAELEGDDDRGEML